MKIMKICWDNLEKLRYSQKTGKWYKNNSTYIYRESCDICGDPYLMVYKGKGHKNKYCSKSCSNASRIGNLNPNYGKSPSEETRKKISRTKIGDKNPSWKGGVKKKGIPTYNTYAHQIDWVEEVRRNADDPNVLEVKCTYCGKWFVPKRDDIRHRIQYLKGNYIHEYRLYCSKSCKKECPIYHKSYITLMKEDAVRAGRLNWIELNREVQPELRQLVLKRDNYTCQKCGNTEYLHCHHILPASIEPIESADIDNCITLCEECHKKAHQKDGCKYGQLRICA